MKAAWFAFLLAGVSAHAIETFQAEEVKPWQPPPQQPPQRQQPHVQPVPSHPPGPVGQRERVARPQASGVAAILGVWQTNIPGAVYTTPSSQAGYDLLHVSSGAAAGLLRLQPDGSYSWNSYGGKRGKWVGTGRADYPVEIIDTVENKRWLVGLDPKSGELIVWAGSYWYNGRRAAVK